MSFTAIALSGGVDSLVAALLLKEDGHRLIGIHFTTGYGSVDPETVAETGRSIGVPTEIADCGRRFQQDVVESFIREYQSGRTPSPCLICNSRIKFGTVMDLARSMGADRLATGHYARVRQEDSGRICLKKGRDEGKDQSYFLGFLTRTQLERAVFPLGDRTKDDVRKIAESRGLRPAEKKESQDVCFIREGYAAFLEKQAGFHFRPGPIVTRDGSVVGEHPGLHRFTVGQRRGINCPAAHPYYVLGMDTQGNRLIVGEKKELLSSALDASEMNWIQPPPESAFDAKVRIRYRHQAVSATVFIRNQQRSRIVFRHPQASVTPGQGAVIYREDEVLGAGWIQRAIP